MKFIGGNSKGGNCSYFLKMFEEIQKILDGIDKEHALTIKEISEMIDKEERRIADILKKMRIRGLIAFEKREVEMIAEINYSNKEKKAQRIHRTTPFHYWDPNNGNRKRKLTA